MSWYESAREHIQKLDATLPADLPFKDRQTAVRDAYPWGGAETSSVYLLAEGAAGISRAISEVGQRNSGQASIAAGKADEEGGGMTEKIIAAAYPLSVLEGDEMNTVVYVMITISCSGHTNADCTLKLSHFNTLKECLDAQWIPREGLFGGKIEPLLDDGHRVCLATPKSEAAFQ